MHPKQVLIEALELRVAPSLSDFGFHLFASEPKFVRTRGELVDVISFSRSKWNTDDNCTFWTAWSVRSKAFSSWYKSVWSVPPADDFLLTTNDWLIAGWPPRNPNGGFTLQCSPILDNEEMARLVDACCWVGIPFLEAHSTPEQAAEYRLANFQPIRALDLLMMSNQRLRAKAYLAELIAASEASGGSVMGYARQTIEEFSSRYFGPYEL